MVNKFFTTWRIIGKRVEKSLHEIGFLRIDEEYWCKRVNGDTKVYFHLMPFSRVLRDECIRMCANVGFSYPAADYINQKLWGTKREAQISLKEDVYVPLYADLHEIDSRVLSCNLLFTLENSEAINLIRDILARFTKDPQQVIFSLSGGKDMACDVNSKFYNQTAFENYLPSMYLALGDKASAVKQSQNILETIPTGIPYRVRYERFLQDIIQYC
jgi:hypothetical protein